MFGPLVPVPYFPDDTSNAFVFRDIVSIDYTNFTKTVTAHFEKIAILCWGGGHIFEAGIFGLYAG
jgi:hypothetical protein